VLFAIKTNESDRDSKSLFLVSRIAGLLYYNGTAATAAQSALASLTVDEAGETVAYIIDSSLTGIISTGTKYWGVKTIDTDGLKLTRSVGLTQVSHGRVDATTAQSSD
jgi:hypothetical protein